MIIDKHCESSKVGLGNLLGKKLNRIISESKREGQRKGKEIKLLQEKTQRMAREEDSLKQELEELQKQLGKKQKFEDAVFSLKSLHRDLYPSASPSLRKLVLFDLFCLDLI